MSGSEKRYAMNLCYESLKVIESLLWYRGSHAKLLSAGFREKECVF